MKFAKYLQEQILQVDVRDGSSPETHFGSARVPLVRLLRQGLPSVAQSFELDLYEPVLNTWVGRLRLLATNEGGRVDQGLLDTMAGTGARAKTPDRRGMAADRIPASAPSAQPRTTKKVYSRPLDTPLKGESNTQMETLLTRLGTTFDYKSEQPGVALATSEDARKKLRIARLRKQTVV